MPENLFDGFALSTHLQKCSALARGIMSGIRL